MNNINFNIRFNLENTFFIKSQLILKILEIYNIINEELLFNFNKEHNCNLQLFKIYKRIIWDSSDKELYIFPLMFISNKQIISYVYGQEGFKLSIISLYQLIYTEYLDIFHQKYISTFAYKEYNLMNEFKEKLEDFKNINIDIQYIFLELIPIEIHKKIYKEILKIK